MNILIAIRIKSRYMRKQVIPEKLKEGDEIRIITPARSASLQWISKYFEPAVKKLTDLGFKISYGKHIYEIDEFDSSSIASRVEDLHAAFLDKNVKAVITVIGGFNSNQLLKYLDYKIIRNNPKILCGYSDITAVSDSIYAKTGLVTYYGPHLIDFGGGKENQYTIDYFRRCLMEEKPFELKPSGYFYDRYDSSPEKRGGYLVINEGKAEGKLVGGNLCTFNLLQGTEYMPDIKDSILFVEDDYRSDAATFDRDLQSLIHQPGFESVKGLMIGRFQKESNVSGEKLTKIIKTKKELDGIPVVADVNFGHASPRVTLPIGGEAALDAGRNGKVNIRITKH